MRKPSRCCWRNYEDVRSLLHEFDYAAILSAEHAKRMSGVAQAIELVLGLVDGKERYVVAVTVMSKGFVHAVPHERAMATGDESGKSTSP